jgi:hypothetical protein
VGVVSDRGEERVDTQGSVYCEALKGSGEAKGSGAVAAISTDPPSDSAHSGRHAQAKKHFPGGTLCGHLCELAYAACCVSGRGPNGKPNTKLLRDLADQGAYLLESVSCQHHRLWFQTQSEYDRAKERLDEYRRAHPSKRGGPRCKSAPSA